MQQQPSDKRSPAASSNQTDEGGARGRSTLSASEALVRFGGLALVDAVAIYFAYSLVQNGQTAIAVILGIVTAVINWLYLDDRVFPIRWLTPGLLLMLLMVIYPLVYSVYIATTNYSDGHLLTKEQVVAQLQGQYYSPQNAVTYQWMAYRSPDGKYKVVLKDPSGKLFIGSQDEALQPYSPPGGNPPANIDNYTQLDASFTAKLNSLKYLGDLTKITIKSGANLIKISGLDKASEQLAKYTYDSGTGTLTDHETGKSYTESGGNFVDSTGKALEGVPGFTTVVGLNNYQRVVSDRNIRQPFLGVFIWTFVFAFLSVALTFAVGLGMALVLNDPKLPFRTVFRSLTIIPYTIPAVISTLIWVGLLNPYYGQFTKTLQTVFGQAAPWPPLFSDGTWAKVGILFINTWLGFPYMMLLCLGALQAIPTDMYEAADIDGANRWTQFRSLTFPLLLVSVLPLLIGSFAFNFNNFGIIELYNQGGPPIAGVQTPAGQTDILISYTYRLAFSGGQGADYGLASAIALFIFALVALITIFNFRFTRQLEEVT